MDQRWKRNARHQSSTKETVFFGHFHYRSTVNFQQAIDQINLQQKKRMKPIQSINILSKNKSEKEEEEREKLNAHPIKKVISITFC